MAKSLTAQTFGVPSHGVLELIETSDKVAWLSEAGYGYETRLRELEHQFEFKAAELREEYLSIVLQSTNRRSGRRRPWRNEYP